MKYSDFIGLRVLVFGLGLHGGGVAVTNWLIKHGAKVTVTDIKTEQELAVSLAKLKSRSIKLVLGRHPLSLLKDCDMIIQNPGVPTDHDLLKVARKEGILIENEASLFLKLCPTKNIAAVTGTRGKSTTVSLLGAVLKKINPKTVVAGNIRDNLLFDVLDSLKNDSFVVLELSSWQLEVVGVHKLKIPYAVITNVLPDHLDRYKSFTDYIQAKTMIFTGQEADDSLILNWDNLNTRKMVKQAKAKVYWFSVKKQVSQGCYIKDKKVYFTAGKINEILFRISDISLPGKHNLSNVLAAVVTARLLGVTADKIKTAVKEFKGLHDRLEYIKTINKVFYYNDTTSTSPDATKAALNTFKKHKIILIAGGTDKKLSYRDLAKHIKKRVKVLILLPGTATVKLQKELIGYKKIILATTMTQAVNWAKKVAAAGDVVLLSPGSASFGLFKHEFDRGEAFKKAVLALN